jgi:hypothetical protein
MPLARRAWGFISKRRIISRRFTSFMRTVRAVLVLFFVYFAVPVAFCAGRARYTGGFGVSFYIYT